MLALLWAVASVDSVTGYGRDSVQVPENVVVVVVHPDSAHPQRGHRAVWLEAQVSVCCGLAAGKRLVANRHPGARPGLTESNPGIVH